MFKNNVGIFFANIIKQKKIKNRTMYKKIFILLFVLSIVVISCTRDKKDVTDDIPQKIDTSEIFSEIKQVYYSMPSPMEIASIIEKYKQNFSPDLLLDLDKAKSYSSTKAQALNMGMYSTDIAFLTITGNYQYSKQYFSVLVFISNELDITEGINDTLLKSIEENIEDIEKVKELTSIAFFKSDAFLKENSKQKIATYIINGSWLESVYLIAQLGADENIKSDIFNLLIDQRLVLANIIKIDEQQKIDEDLIKTMKKLKQLFDNCVVITKKEIVDPYTDSLRVKTTVEYNFNKNKIKKISDEISKIRENFISLH